MKKMPVFIRIEIEDKLVIFESPENYLC